MKRSPPQKAQIPRISPIRESCKNSIGPDLSSSFTSDIRASHAGIVLNELLNPFEGGKRRELTTME